MEVLIFIVFIVAAIANSKGKKDAQKRREEARRHQPPAYTPPPTAKSMPNGAFEWLEDIFTPPAAPAPLERPYAPAEPQPYTGSMAYDSSEGTGFESAPAMEGMPSMDSREGVSLQDPSRSARLSHTVHTVRPFTEGDHSHTESSMTGDVPCPPAAAGAASRVNASAHPALGLRFDPAGVRQGIIYAEILGKPRAMRMSQR